MRKLVPLLGVVGFVGAAVFACTSFESDEVPAVDAGFDVPPVVEAAASPDAAPACPEVVGDFTNGRRLRAGGKGAVWIHDARGIDGGPVTAISTIDEAEKSTRPQFVLAPSAQDVCLAGQSALVLTRTIDPGFPTGLAVKSCPVGSAACEDTVLPLTAPGPFPPELACDGELMAFVVPPELRGLSLKQTGVLLTGPRGAGDARLVALASGTATYFRPDAGIFSGPLGLGLDAGGTALVGDDAGARNVTALVARPEHVFYVVQEGGTPVLSRVAATGGPATVLARQVTSFVAVDATSAFFVSATGGIFRVKRDATSEATAESRRIFDVPTADVTSLGVSDAFIYFSTRAQVKRLPKAGCPN